MALPLYMLWGLQMRTEQKVSLTCVFSLGLVIATFDILRTVESLASGTFSGVALWSSMEVTMAVIVASLLTYRTLLGIKTRKGTVRYISWDRYRRIDKNNSRKASAGFDSAKSDPSKTFASVDEGVLESQISAPSANGSSVSLAHIAGSR